MRRRGVTDRERSGVRCAASAMVFYGWAVAALCGVTMGLSGPGHSFYFVNFVDHIIADTGITRLELSTVWTLCLFTAAIWQPIGGRLADQHGCCRCMKWMVLPYAVAVGLLGQVRASEVAPLQLFGTFLVVRSFGPGWLNTILAKIFNCWFVRRRGRASMVLVVINNAELLAVPATRALINLVGWRTTYAVMASVIVLGMLLFLLLVRDRPEDMGLLPDGDDPTHAGACAGSAGRGKVSAAAASGAAGSPAQKLSGVALGVALRSPLLWVLMVAQSLQGISWGGLNLHAAAIWEELGLSPDALSLAYVVMSAGGLAGAILGGWLVDRLRPEHKKQLVSLSILFASCVPLSLLFRLQTKPGGTWAAALHVSESMSGAVAIGGFGVGYGLMNGVWGVMGYTLLADLYGTRALGALTGLWGSAGLLGMGTGPLLLTLLRGANGESYAVPLQVRLCAPRCCHAANPCSRCHALFVSLRYCDIVVMWCGRC